MQDQPEKIYNWLNTQLSIARHYGGINFNGAWYVIDYKDPQQPLVRFDAKKPKKEKADSPQLEIDADQENAR
jgi:hypothetical protein